MLFIGALALVDSMVSQPAAQTVLSLPPSNDPNGIRRIAASRAKQIATFLIAATVVVTAILILLSPFGLPISGAYFVALIGFSTIIELLRASVVACIVRDRQMQRLSGLVVSDAAIALAAIITMLSIVGPTAEAYMLGYLIGRLGSLGFAIVAVRDLGFYSHPRVALDPSISVRVLEFNKGLLFLGPFGWFQSYFDRYLLAAILGAQQVGFYTASYAVASRPFAVLSNLLTSYFRGSLAPINDGDLSLSTVRLRVLANWLTVVLLFSMLSLLVILVVGHVIVHLLLEQSYRSFALKLLTPIALAQSFSIACHAFDNVLLSVSKSKLLLAIQAGLTPLSVLLVFVGASAFGLEGAAYGRVAFECLHFVILGVLVFKTLPMDSPDNSNNG